MWYEIYSIVEGAFDSSEEVDGHIDEAESVAHKLAHELQEEAVGVEGDPLSWEVYIIPHYCVVGMTSEDECVCSQYLTDHRPFVTSEDFTS